MRRVMGLLLITVLFSVCPAFSFELEKPECIAPAKPGGGHDIMCRLLAGSLADSLLLDMSIRYMPGGIGALAYNHVISVRPHAENVVVAASTGSALNLALHKFGRYTEDDVRWLGAVGADYGVVAVKGDSSLNTLGDLLERLKKNPSGPVIGGAGSIGSQDWMKMALLLDKAGLDPTRIRYISFEGGGEASEALLRGHIQIFSGDITEVASYLESGRIRVLAVFSSKRLPGGYSSIPTATEQGYDLVWPVWRGYYLPPDISDEAYRWWVNTLYRLESSGVLEKERSRLHLFPLSLVGDEFDHYVKYNVQTLREFGKRFGLVQ